MRWRVWLGNIMEMYRTANPGMTVRPRPWPRGVASCTELELIKWHKRIWIPLLEIHRQHYNILELPNQRNATWEGAFYASIEWNEFGKGRINRIRPMVDRRSCATFTPIYLTFIFVQTAFFPITSNPSQTAWPISFSRPARVGIMHGLFPIIINNESTCGSTAVLPTAVLVSRKNESPMKAQG